MITEKHLNHILKEMDYTVLNIAKELSKPNELTFVSDEKISIKYLKEKVALLKFHIDWIRVDIEEDKPE